MADSWLIDGNCKNCRRKNYCQKPCTLNKRMTEFAIRTATRQAIEKVTGLDKIYDVMKRGSYGKL